jgi:dihydropteroate synthase
MKWSLRGRELQIDRPIVMGILNVTPDSFSDGGRFADPEEAVNHALRLLDEGADIIDVGGESTRPQGARPVSAQEEMRRVLPVVERLARLRPAAVVSIDTVKSDVARAALESGAHIVNDVSGLRLDPQMGATCAEAKAGVVLMHSRGSVTDMATYEHARYGHVVEEVVKELEERISAAKDSGIRKEHIVVDPGIGFSKKTEHSLEVLSAVPRFLEWGLPILVGVSRKRFVGEITGQREPASRLSGTLGANVAALALGARIFRVHDVAENRQALDVAWAVIGER